LILAIGGRSQERGRGEAFRAIWKSGCEGGMLLAGQGYVKLNWIRVL